jgi:hypothetical protein
MKSRGRHQPDRASGPSRRNFLASLGAGAVVATVAPTATLVAGTAPATAAAAPPSVDRFTRMFNLPPFADATPQMQAALIQLGAPGGLLDAKDALTVPDAPRQLIVDPALSVNNPNNPTHTAGTTFMGQFMDHDITFDLVSTLGVPFSVDASVNGRRPYFDLDSVYGAGPSGSPQLYAPAGGGISLRVESGGLFEDLPRDAGNTAIIADRRNDENVIIAGLHAAFLLFHNHAVDHVKSIGPSGPLAAVFEQARNLTRWHYQWMILHEFLPLFVGQAMVDDVLAHGRHFYTPGMGGAQIPVEFQGAAYRFGHSMVRPSYRANLAGDNGQPFFALIFDAAQNGPDPADLTGGHRAPRRFVGWQTFFDFGVDPFTGLREVKPNKKIDTRLSTPLFHLPLSTLAIPGGPTVLAQRNLLRHLTWQLPSGQSIAQLIGAPVLGKNDFKELKPLGVNLDQSTPLWYYVLKEAQLIEDGLHLGPVGGRIVAEVIIGLLQADPTSYLNQPGWTPTLPAPFSGAGNFRMVDFLTFARVDPASRGQ